MGKEQAPPFRVTYSFNCDGGYQEFSTAAQIVRDMFPYSLVEAKRTHAYPIRVIITTTINGREVEVWSGQQQNLFEKDCRRRQQTTEEIRASLGQFQQVQENLAKAGLLAYV